MNDFAYLIEVFSDKNIFTVVFYNIVVLLFYFVAFGVSYLVEINMIFKRNKDVKANNEVSDTNVCDPEVEQIIENILLKLEKKAKFHYQLSKIFLIIYFLLIIYAFITKGNVFNNRLFVFLYCAYPIIICPIIMDGYSYWKKSKKSNV